MAPGRVFLHGDLSRPCALAPAALDLVRDGSARVQTFLPGYGRNGVIVGLEPRPMIPLVADLYLQFPSLLRSQSEVFLRGIEEAFSVTGYRGVFVADRPYDDGHPLPAPLPEDRDFILRFQSGTNSRRLLLPGATPPPWRPSFPPSFPTPNTPTVPSSIPGAGSGGGAYGFPLLLHDLDAMKVWRYLEAMAMGGLGFRLLERGFRRNLFAGVEPPAPKVRFAFHPATRALVELLESHSTPILHSLPRMHGPCHGPAPFRPAITADSHREGGAVGLQGRGGP